MFDSMARMFATAGHLGSVKNWVVASCLSRSYAHPIRPRFAIRSASGLGISKDKDDDRYVCCVPGAPSHSTVEYHLTNRSQSHLDSVSAHMGPSVPDDPSSGPAHPTESSPLTGVDEGTMQEPKGSSVATPSDQHATTTTPSVRARTWPNAGYVQPNLWPHIPPYRSSRET